MERFEESAFCREIEAFRLPRYADLPDFRLYIDQLIALVEKTLAPLMGAVGEKWITATMVGNTIGRGLNNRARIYAYRAILLCLIIGVILTFLILLLAPLFLWFYDLSSAQVAHDALLMIRILAVTMPIKLINMTVIMGVLRAGGDVIFSLLFESCTMWFIGVPLAFIGALVLQWPVYLVFTLVIAEEVVKFVLCLWRTFSNKWIHTMV